MTETQPRNGAMRDQRVVYLNGRRWQTAVVRLPDVPSRPGTRRFRATYVDAHMCADHVTMANIPACWLTATAGMHKFVR